MVHMVYDRMHNDAWTARSSSMPPRRPSRWHGTGGMIHYSRSLLAPAKIFRVVPIDLSSWRESTEIDLLISDLDS